VNGGRARGVLAILGATATGKSALAVAVAERLGGEVISADAFAAYRGLDVGTAKPTAEERRGVPHHLIDVKDPTEPYNAGEFASRARELADDILARGRLPIVCGGTGFYVRAFFEGLFEGPTRSAAVRAALEAVAERRGTPFLARALALLDPASAAGIAPNDLSRLVRFLEIVLATGERPSRLFAERPGARWEKPAVKLLLSLPRPTLYGRIAERLSRTILPALPAEVSGLLASGVPLHAPAFAAIGYRDTSDYLSGRIGREEWEERILRSTRRFAKRQETWFRKEAGLVPLRADRGDLTDLAVALARPLFLEGGPT
jgi:tRNA dimethylallyltransferase